MMTKENILGALSFYCYRCFSCLLAFFLLRFSVVEELSKPTDQHVPLWKPFTDVVAFSRSLLPIWVGYQTSVYSCLGSACVLGLVAPVHFCAYHGSSRRSFSCELWAICQLFAYGSGGKVVSRNF